MKLQSVYGKPKSETTAARYCDVNSIVFVFIMALRCCCLPFCNNEDTRLILLHSDVVLLLCRERTKRFNRKMDGSGRVVKTFAEAALETLSLQSAMHTKN